MASRHHGRSVWLLTWESPDTAVSGVGKVLAILNPRWSADRVRMLTEQLYIVSFASVAEKLSIALSEKNNAYLATPGCASGVSWRGEFFCGHNPWIWTRKVDGFHVHHDDTGRETVRWTERRRSDLSVLRDLLNPVPRGD